MKGAPGSGCKDLSSWWIVMYQSLPRLGRFHANAVVLGKRIIDGIILRCLRSKKYRTILGLCRKICGKRPMATNPSDEMVRNGWSETLVFLTRWDHFGVALYGESVWLYCVEVGHTGRSVVSCPRVYLQDLVRTYIPTLFGFLSLDA